jgi:NADPH:quinone reductase-like Zn-dependent oxidoreductase
VEAIDPDLHAGDRVLIVGATGGVGRFAVQLVAHTGATVIATARPDEEQFVRELGAHETIDYTSGSVGEAVRERYPEGVHAIIDLVSQKEAFADLAELVMPGGRVATTLGAADEEALAARQVKGTNIMANPDVARLTKLAELVDSGELKVPIQRVYPFEEVESALRDFQQGTRGKLVISFG